MFKWLINGARATKEEPAALHTTELYLATVHLAGQAPVTVTREAAEKLMTDPGKQTQCLVFREHYEDSPGILPNEFLGYYGSHWLWINPKFVVTIRRHNESSRIFG